MWNNLTCVDDFLNRAFHKLGLVVGRHPGYFVIVPVLVACICFTGYQKIHYEIDPEYLFSPTNGPSKMERAIVEQYFKVNYSHKFNLGRITRPGRFGHVIITSKDGNDNLLRTAVFDELRQLDKMIRNTKAIYEGEEFTYSQICAKWLDTCFNNDILDLHHVIEDVEKRELNLTFPVTLNPVTWDIHLLPVYFGGSVIDEDLIIESVPSMQLAYFLTVDNARQDAIGAAWEEAFLETLREVEDNNVFKHIATARFASRTLELELEENTKTIVPYFSSTFILMALFSVVTCMMTDWVRSKPWLGLLGNVSAAMATVAAFGLCIYLGVDFIGLNLAAPFLMIANRSWLYRALCSGGVDPDDPYNPIDNPEHGCMSWFRDYLAAALNCRPVKVIVILIFACYLAGALYGLTTLQEGLDRRKLSKNDSYSITFYDRQDYYFREFPYRIQVVVSGKYDYSDPVIQAQMENLTRSLEANKYISSAPIYTESWLRSFLSYANNSATDVEIKDEKTFIKMLKDTWLSPKSSFSLDVKFDEAEEHIIASRFLIQAVNVSGTNQEKDMVKELRRICDQSSLNASVFHPYFVFFDQFELVKPTSIQCMVFGALIMMLISFIFIPNVLCCLWVAFCIISIELGVAGYMALWDVNLDSISMINLIMCIGFSVDFTAHICYAYMSSKQKTAEDRVKESLYSLGLPIVQGATSTILGLIALVLAGTYIFMVFFKMVFLVIFIGAMHGMFLLPVLLSLFGPSSYKDKKTDSDKAEQRKVSEKDMNCKLQQPYVIPHPTLTYYHSSAPAKSLQDSPATSLAAFEDRDPGLGTSEDSNSTESGSSQSRRREGQLEPENQRRHDVWRRSIGVLYGTSQFQTSSPPAAPPLDYSATTPETQNDQNDQERRAVRTVSYLGPYSPHRPANQLHRDHRRSRSYHNLHHSSRYLTDPRYP
ncbi:patched domain-containing protein isoform X3 [Bombus fervidus]|uniref:patched domain-containing protein isoform X3 n=1 Tax=Bombus fervidus TaxID=203811 RepID=UPI003AB72081